MSCTEQRRLSGVIGAGAGSLGGYPYEQNEKSGGSLNCRRTPEIGSARKPLRR
jgi:hypothetical protein